jgi:hypothetical protein
MKKYIVILLSVFSLLIISCSDDFLKEQPYHSYSTGLTDPNIVEAELLGLHRIYGELWGWSSRQGFLNCWQLGTDVCVAGATEGVENPFYQYADLNAENAGVEWLWRKCYEFVNNANLIIADVGENNPAATAEAKFFRAYAYHTLVTLWGNVPLVTEPTKTPTFNYTRQPVADVDKVIEEDLAYAVTNLPDLGQAAKPSRINKDMARQLAAEAYLRIGMRDNTYFAKAEQMATDIIDGGSYSLIEARYGQFTGEGGDYYRDMFRFGNQRRAEGNTEGIWVYEMEYSRNVTGGTIDNPQHRRVWQPAYHKIDGMTNADSLGGRGNGRMRLSNFMKHTVWSGLDGDIRNSNYNIRRYTYYNKPNFTMTISIDAKGFRVADGTPGATTATVSTGDRIYVYETDSLEVWYPYCTKWGGYDPSDDFGYAVVKDWPVMRLGETYLLRAEARFRQGSGKLEAAAADLNKLRDRAFKEARDKTGNPNLGKVSPADITIDFILDERARELIGEENRRMTLVRTQQLTQERINKNGCQGEPDNKKITGFDPGKHTLLPVPLREIQLNKEVKMENNPGYEN